MTDKDIKLLIEVPAETKRAIERAAAARGISVSEFVQIALRKFLFDIDDEDGEAD